jgi:hypothetical protein
MRNGSAALFPLLLAIMAMFWFIWIMGGSTDTLHRVNKVEDLQHLQERLLPAAMQKYIDEVQKSGPDGETMDTKRDRARQKAHDEIQNIMQRNQVDN